MTKHGGIVTQWPESVHSKARDANRKHVILDIDYHTNPKLPAEDAPTICVCGWTGGGGPAFQDHRVASGQRRASLSGGGGRADAA